MAENDRIKQQAAYRALEEVQSGMCLGLGTGSTAAHFVHGLGEKLRSGALREICGVPTSRQTAVLAQQAGIPLVSLAQRGELDLAVDGADEVDPQLNLIKGLGKALLREKIVEIHARRFLVVVDDSKLVPRLGRGPLPVEIVAFQWEAQVRWLGGLCRRAELWREENGEPVVTDNGNYLVRMWFEGGIPDARGLARSLADRPGIVEHGLFLDMASEVIVASEGGVKMMEHSHAG